MKHTTRNLLFSLLVVIIAGCTTVEPPKRPVAYVFPTVRSFESVAELVSMTVTPEKIMQWLKTAGLYEDLDQNGLLYGDIEILARGLARSGYAELDMRKTKLNMRWIAIRCVSKDCVEILSGYNRKPVSEFWQGMSPVQTITPAFRQYFAHPDTWVWNIAQRKEKDGDILHQLATLCPLGKLVPSFWLGRTAIALSEDDDDNV